MILRSLFLGKYSLFLLAAAVVEGFVDFFQVLIGHVGIYLRRRDRSVAEHGLHAADVGAVDEEISGKAVTERMRVDVFDDAGFGGVVLDEPLDAARSETERLALGVPLVDEALLRERDEQRGIGIGPAIEVAGEGAFGGRGDEDDAELTAFAAYGELFFLEIDMLPVEGGELGDTKAGRKQELEYGPIAEIAQRRALGGQDDTLDLVGIEEVDLAGRCVSDLDLFGREGLDILPGEEFEERPQDDGVITLGVPLEGVSAPGGTAIERDTVFPYGIERDVFRLFDPGRADELVETAAVALDGPE